MSVKIDEFTGEATPKQTGFKMNDSLKQHVLKNLKSLIKGVELGTREEDCRLEFIDSVISDAINYISLGPNTDFAKPFYYDLGEGEIEDRCHSGCFSHEVLSTSHHPDCPKF